MYCVRESRVVGASGLRSPTVPHVLEVWEVVVFRDWVA